MYSKEDLEICLNYIKEIHEWDVTSYQEFWQLTQLVSEQEYGDFNAKLIPNIERNLIRGIRLPVVRKLAGQIAKGNSESYLTAAVNYAKLAKCTHEEKMLRGFVIGHIKDIDKILAEMTDFVGVLDNWSVCDSFCTSLKITKKHKENVYPYILECLKSEEEYVQRFAYVMFLNYYIEEAYLEKIYEACNRDDMEQYYVKMAVAWLLSMCYVKFPQRTLEFMKGSKIDDFTYNKSIQKMIESYQLSQEVKVYLKTLKRP